MVQTRLWYHDDGLPVVPTGMWNYDYQGPVPGTRNTLYQGTSTGDHRSMIMY